jgi:hypothetical protein
VREAGEDFDGGGLELDGGQRIARIRLTRGDDEKEGSDAKGIFELTATVFDAVVSGVSEPSAVLSRA